ncbi:uncharacterized protein LOC141852221 isoform X2 [Brevipalpus obovatus]|uniref:uncharacterized protein LOC141852221 isoform X2 n=1 Tax=Brevipalpus obovatus TaxID=246614 RepID=UPI003D9F9680
MTAETDEHEKTCKVPPDLFKGVQFCLCDDVDNSESVKRILVEGGGKLVNYLSDIATHLIADNPEHPDINEAVEIYEKPVVTSLWVWLSAKANCLLPTAAFNPQKNAVFSNVIACPSNVCKEDLEALWAMITFHGGSLQAQLNSKVTHLITTKPEGPKYEKSIEISSIKMVTPDWVVDSVKMKQKCDEDGYHPKLLVLPNSQPSKVESSCTTTLIPHSIDSSKSNNITTMTTTCVEVPVPHPATSSAQVTLRTVSLPPSTFITAVPVSDTHNQVPINQQQQARIRVLVPSQNTDATFAQQQQNSQPRQVYLHLQAQPPIRQQTSNQLNFIQIRQQQPRSATTPEGIQMPVKPIILQQRIQPPVHQQQPQQQTQSFLISNQSQNEIDKDQQIQQNTSMPSQNVQQPQSTATMNSLQHSSQQQQLLLIQPQQQQKYQQMQIIQSPNQAQLPPHPQEQARHQLQAKQVSSPQQFHQQQIQQTNMYKMGPQTSYQARPGMQTLVNTSQGLNHQNQPSNEPNQQVSQIRILQSQGQPMMSIPRQPMQRPTHMQQIQVNAGHQVRMSQQSQFYQQGMFPVRIENDGQSQPVNQDQIMQDMQQTHQTSIRMVNQIREQNPQQHMLNIQQNGPNLVRNISPQHVVYQKQTMNANGPPQRVPSQGIHQMMPGQPQVYNQQPGQTVRMGHPQMNNSQVPRVPPLRMPQNFQQVPRPQYRGQAFRNMPPNQQMLNSQPRQFIKPQIQQGQVPGPVGQRQPMQYSQQFSSQGPTSLPVQVGQHSPHQIQSIQNLSPDGQPLQSANHDQSPSQALPHSLTGSHPNTSGVHMEVHAMPANHTTIICGPPGSSNNSQWNQQWNSSPGSTQILQNHQRAPLQGDSQAFRPQQMFVAQQNGPVAPHKISQFPMMPDVSQRKIVPGQPTGRVMQSPVGRRFPLTPHTSDHVRPLGGIIPTTTLPPSNVRLSNPCTQLSTNTTTSSSPSSPSNSITPTLSTTTSITCSPSITSPVVTPKTKTTLANFLNTRLQNNASVGATSRPSNEGSNSSQTSLSSHSSGNGFSCYTSSVKNCPLSGSISLSYVPNKSGFSGSHGVMIPNGEFSTSRPVEESTQVIQERLYGHESKTLVPPEFCLAGCVFYFVDHESPQSTLDGDRKELCRKIILKYGGNFEDEYSASCTHVICETQDTSLVRQALKEGKRCVTLFWVHDIIAEGRLRPPYKIWHLPRAFDFVFRPCRDHIIATSNFEGRDRVLLKELIIQSGAKYTAYLSHKNTILVCKRPEGTKFKKATEWDMPIVNVLWLQDIFFGHHLPALSALHKSPRYTKFDLKDACDLDYNLVRQWMAPWRVPIKVPEDLPQRIQAKKESENEKLTEITKPPEPIDEAMEVEKAKEENKEDEELIGTKPSVLPVPPSSTLDSSEVPAQNSSTTPVVPSDQAVIPDTPLDSSSVPTSIVNESVNNIDSNSENNGEPMQQGDETNCEFKESSSQIESEPASKKVRTDSELSQPNTNDSQADPVSKATSSNSTAIIPLGTTNPGNVSVKVMFTGFKDLSDFLKITTKLGITVTNDHTQCTHLVMDRVARTVKFMCALSYVNYVVHPDWLVSCSKRGHLVDETPFLLKDSKAETMFGFDLKECLEMRKARGTPLFQSFLFCITKSCVPSQKILKEIAESAGAIGVTRKLPSIKQLKQLERRKDVKFVVITKEEDLPICQIFFSRSIPVLNTEFLLHSLLTQEIRYEPYAFSQSV